MIEVAAHRHDSGVAETALARAPEHIRRSVNRARASRGLPPILSVSQRAALEEQLATATVAAWGAVARGPGGFTAPDSPRAKQARGPVPPAATRTAARVDRVLAVVAAGRARARDIGGDLDEIISQRAFSAEQLNREAGWLAKDGHEPRPGSILAMRGDRLRAHDTPVGLVIEWIPDLSRSWERDVFRRIRDGATGVSAAFNYRRSDVREMRLPDRVRVITKAELMHVAIGLPRDGGAVRGAVARAFTGRPVGPDSLAADIAEIVRASRWAEGNRP